jgi:hypothetical protein
LSKAADLIKRMDRLGASSPATPAPAAEPRTTPRTSAPPRPSGGGRRRRAHEAVDAGTVRYTVDLDPELHRMLRVFALDQRTDASEVIRALIGLLNVAAVEQAVIAQLRAEVADRVS